MNYLSKDYANVKKIKVCKKIYEDALTPFLEIPFFFSFLSLSLSTHFASPIPVPLMPCHVLHKQNKTQTQTQIDPKSPQTKLPLILLFNNSPFLSSLSPKEREDETANYQKPQKATGIKEKRTRKIRKPKKSRENLSHILYPYSDTNNALILYM